MDERSALVLVVDDEPPNVELLSAVLGRAGYRRVQSASSALEALEAVRAVRPDIILLDLRMPGIDGVGFLELLEHELGDDEFVPVLVLTADSSAECRRRALASGATDFVTKPFEVNELLLRVRNLVRTRLLHEQVRARAGELEDRLAAQLAERLEEKEAFIEALVAAQEAERERIATEIHDDTIQMLTAISIRMELLRDQLPKGDAVGALDQIIKECTAATERLRTLLFDLRPPALGVGGLAAALQDQLEFTADGSLEWTIDDFLVGELPRPVELALFRIGQEAIANARDHAGASQLFVELREEPGWVEITVRDNGSGFDPDSVMGKPRPGHLGLVAMHERAEALGGRLTITSRAGEGTTVTARVPLRHRRAPWRPVLAAS
ncbi:MAG: response regulator [Acidimicrobiales bacterium]|nr:response regulator [Acidimicrobiales bacterium]